MKKTKTQKLIAGGKTLSWKERVVRDFHHNWMLYLMMTPVILYYLVFKFGPMFGVSIAFMDYKPAKGFLGSQWVGFKHFINFFTKTKAIKIFPIKINPIFTNQHFCLKTSTLYLFFLL